MFANEIVHMSVMFFLIKSNTRVESWEYCISAASHAHLIYNSIYFTLYVWCMEHAKKNNKAPNNVSVSYRTLVLGVQF